MKVHLGCGTIYLKDYINLDICPKYLANEAPKEILAQNTTTFENYYKHGFGEGSGICVADIRDKINELPFKSNVFEEAILLHVLEHIPSYDVGKVLNEIYRVIEPGGSFVVAVPDLKETAKLLAKAQTDEEEDWALRLIHGTQRNEWSHHYCGYTRRTLINLLSSYGFTDFIDLPNINFYPAIHIRAIKGEGNE